MKDTSANGGHTFRHLFRETGPKRMMIWAVLVLIVLAAILTALAQLPVRPPSELDFLPSERSLSVRRERVADSYDPTGPQVAWVVVYDLPFRKVMSLAEKHLASAGYTPYGRNWSPVRSFKGPDESRVRLLPGYVGREGGDERFTTVVFIGKAPFLDVLKHRLDQMIRR